MNKKLSYLACATLFGAMLVSCTNDLNVPTKGNPDLNGTLSPVVAPDLITYSGNQVLFNSFNGTSVSTRAGNEDAIYDENDYYFSYETVTDDWIDIYEINGTKGPENVFNFLRYGLENQYIELSKNDWIKEEWLASATGEWGPVNADPYFPKGTTGLDAIKLLKTDFSIKGKTGDTFTFYPYVTSQTDQGHKEIGVFYYDDEGNLHKKQVWDSDVTGNYENGKIHGVKITVLKDRTFGLYFSGRTHTANSNDTYYYTLAELNDPSENADDLTHRNLTVHAGLVPDGYLGFYQGSLLLVEDWDDFDFDDFMIFTKENLYANDRVGNGDDLKDPEETTTGDDCPGKIDPSGEKCPHGSIYHDEDDYCSECDKDPDTEGHYCHHPKQEGGNTGGNTGGGNTGGTVTPTPNPNPNGKYENNEVEINLSINDIHTLPGGGYKYGLADLVSKLSIHVRYPHDVEVILPVPEQIYCDQDDLYILKDHYFDENGDPNWRYDGEIVTWASFIGNNTVTLTVEYVPAGEDQLTNKGYLITLKDGSQCTYGGYIRVYTEGINEAVIDYCRKNFGDGINFEVYNYYNRGNQYTTGSYASITTEELQYYFLSRSMVNFDWNWYTKPHDNVTVRTYPDFYINAFHKDLDGNPVKGDCYMWILGDNHAKCNDTYLYYIENHSIKGSGSFTWKHEDETTGCQRNNFFNPYQGDHFNGSSFNWIYTSKGVTGGIDSSDMTSAPALWPFAKEANESNDAPYQYFKVGENYLYNFFKPNN